MDHVFMSQYYAEASIDVILDMGDSYRPEEWLVEPLQKLVGLYNGTAVLPKFVILMFIPPFDYRNRHRETDTVDGNDVDVIEGDEKLCRWVHHFLDHQASVQCNY
jgi:hypothetical protein